MKNSDTNKITEPARTFAFAAIHPYEETNIVSGEEKEIRGYDFISWGDNNSYPSYLQSLYENVPTLQSVINAVIDYVSGEDVRLENKFDKAVNTKGDTPEDLVRALTEDYAKFGGFAVNITRNKGGEISSLDYISLEFLRSDKECERFFYSTEWSKGRRAQFIEYPVFKANSKDINSIFYYKNKINKVYPIPVYASAKKSCEIEKSIDEYHLNSVNNSFMGSYIINFANGIPSEKIQDEIEEEVNEKFSGKDNAGRIMISFSKDKDSAVTLQKLDTDDFGDKYQSLAKRSQNQIFTSFRMSPALAGISVEGTVFDETSFKEGYKLFNKTTILPMQKTLARAFSTIFGEDVLVIKPFDVNFEKEENNEEITN